MRRVSEGGLLESFGLPGAGKSTACARLLDSGHGTSDVALREQWREQSVVTRAWFMVTTVLSDITVLAWAFRVLVVTGMWHRKDSLTRLLKLPFYRRRVLNGATRGPVVSDQGMMQSIWASYLSAGRVAVDERSTVALLRKLYLNIPGAIVYFRIDPSIATERVAQRVGGGSRFDGLGHVSIREGLERGNQLMESLWVAATAAGLPVVEIDATLSEEEVSKAMRRTMRRAFGPMEITR